MKKIDLRHACYCAAPRHEMAVVEVCFAGRIVLSVFRSGRGTRHLARVGRGAGEPRGAYPERAAGECVERGRGISNAQRYDATPVLGPAGMDD